MPVLAKTLAIIFVAILLGSSAQAQGFGRFDEEPINAPDGYRLVRDPTGSAPTRRVHMFQIDAGTCSARPYGNGFNDCHFQSVRSQLFETRQTQPTEAWYQWSMYLPADFPFGAQQPAGGNYSFAYWHNRECPNIDFEVTDGRSTLYLRTNRYNGPGNCVFLDRIPIVDIASLVGRWRSFEVFVRWSEGADGRAEVYFDGQLMTTYQGPTITRGTPDYNYFKFGIYLNNTRDTNLVRQAIAFYTEPKRASTRAGLSR